METQLRAKHFEDGSEARRFDATTSGHARSRRLVPAPRTGYSLALAAALASLIIAAPASPTAAQTHVQGTAPATRAEQERELAAKRTALDAAAKRAADIARQAEQLASERAEVKTRLLATANDVQRAEAQLNEIERRLSELEAQDKLLRGSLAGRHAELAQLMGAMQRMGRNPPPVIVTERKDVLEMIRSAKLLARVFPGLQIKAEALSGELRQLERVTAETRATGERLSTETKRHNEARTRLAALLETNNKAAADRVKELEAIKRESDGIRQSVSDLGELIKRHDQLVESRTRLAEYEADMRRQKAADAAESARAAAAIASAAARTAAAAPATQLSPPPTVVALNVPPVPRAEPEIRPVMLVPGEGRALTNPGRLKPEIPFHRAKARLPLPASGRHVLEFGAATHFGSKSPGLVIATRPGAQITSPSDGWVLFAGPFRSYGQLLIINAGDGYHILMTGLSRIDVQVGQFVLAAEPVGAMSVVAAPKSDGAGDGPVLYVEFRKDGKPIDPRPWWAQGQQKVQG